MNDFIHTVLYPALGSALTILLGMLINAAIDAVKRWTSSTKHGMAFGIVLDACKASFNAKIKPSIQAKMADGKITDEEWAQLRKEVKDSAREIALDQVKNLRGFLPKDLNKWVDVQMEVALGEVFGGTSSGEDEEQDPLANTPASPEDSK